MIELTEKAQNKIIEIANSEGIDNLSLRIKIIGSGCSGMSNNIEFDEIINDLDEVIEINNIKIIIDPISHCYLENAIVDYKEQNYSEGFVFLIPNTTNCGCEKSFAF